MTALAHASRTATSTVVHPALLVLGLAAIVGFRRAAIDAVPDNSLAVGLTFGLGVLALALAAGQRRARPRSSSIVAGLVGGGVLVGIALLIRLGVPGPTIAPAIPLLPWAAVTIIVATSEELVIRGVLFDSLERAGGALAAVLLTSLVFAVMHVPLYGWHVVPLDIGVGLWLGGLRLTSGGASAPALAHTIADLATWWL